MKLKYGQFNKRKDDGEKLNLPEIESTTRFEVEFTKHEKIVTF